MEVLRSMFIDKVATNMVSMRKQMATGLTPVIHHTKPLQDKDLRILQLKSSASSGVAWCWLSEVWNPPSAEGVDVWARYGECVFRLRTPSGFILLNQLSNFLQAQ